VPRHFLQGCHTRVTRRGAATALAWLAAALAAAPLAAQDSAEPREPRLYEEAPYDQVVLKDPDEAPVKIEPLQSRKLPSNPLPSDKLVVRLQDDPNNDYEIAWRDIERVEYFENIVLAEARRLTAAGKFDEAFDHFRYLRRNYPKMPGLEEGVQDFLAAEAESFLKANEYERGYALLIELDSRNHDHPRLADGLGRVMDKLIGDYVAANNAQSARGLLARFSARFKDHPVAVKWQQSLGARAAEAAVWSETALAEKRPREAYEFARQAVEIWPQQPEARAAMEQAHAAWPFVSVGVLEPAPGIGEAVENWSGRRVGRLLTRPLFELSAVGAEGGQYTCPWGQWQRGDLGLQLSVQLRPDARWADGAPMTAAQLARFLIAMADRSDPHYDPVWRDVLSLVEAPAPSALEIRLKRANVLPEALLAAPLARRDAGGEVATGPFALLMRRARETTFAMPNSDGTANRPREIVERTFTKSDDAIGALLRGEVAALDRVNRWDLPLLAPHSELTVAKYAWPTVHCLVPNVARPLPANRTFRRALVYILDREMILKKLILKGREDPGSMVASGPFVKGVTFDDPRGYGNNDQIEPRASEPQLALTLATVAIAQTFPPQTAADGSAVAVAEAQPPTSDEQPAEAPTDKPAKVKPRLVLVHPATEVARAACAAIARYVALLGVEVQLHEQAPGAPLPEEWDLRYGELAAWEPVSDAWRLFGPGGLAAGVSPYMELALRELAAAQDWPTARRLLMEIHTRVHDDVSIVPLWQLNNYCVWHKRLQGVGEAPVTLYQNVDQWKIEPWFPVDTF